MRRGRFQDAADWTPDVPDHAPADEEAVAKERTGQAEEKAFLLGMGFDPPVVARMLARDLAGAVATQRKKRMRWMSFPPSRIPRKEGNKY